MQNDTNNFAKRTAATVKSILSKNGIDCHVENLGDGRTFDIAIEATLENRIALRKAGFILFRSKVGDKSIVVMCF